MKKNFLIDEHISLVFLTAKTEDKDLVFASINIKGEDLEKEIKERDKKDSEREIAPLKKAQDAVELVTDGLDIEDVLKEMTYIFRSKIPEEIWPTPNL